jgi:hypothetical protein
VRNLLAVTLAALVPACATPDHRDAAPPVTNEPTKAAEAMPRPQAQGDVPVVVELFSSEGCSSCPSADRVLRRLVTEQPVSGAHIIGLELHVDYWNYLGWADPFSSSEYSERQARYSKIGRRRGSYTPQMVVAGEREFVGSDETTAKAAIASARARESARVAVTIKDGEAQIAIDRKGLSDTQSPLEVMLAITESDLSTAVLRGENGGETLAHGPVVRSLQRVGAASGESATLHAPLRTANLAHKDHAHVVVFLQRGEGGPIVGAAEIPFS